MTLGEACEGVWLAGEGYTSVRVHCGGVPEVERDATPCVGSNLDVGFPRDGGHY